MSGATDYIGLITIEDGEAYDPDIFNSNNEEIDAQFKKLQYSTGAYVPDFDGFVALGSGNARSGSYLRIGKLVMASFYVKAGTGANLGNGQISVGLPFKAASAVERTYYGGAGIHSPGATGVIYPLHVVSQQGSTVAQLLAPRPEINNGLSAPGLVPYPWKKDDVLRGTLTYRTDDA